MDTNQVHIGHVVRFIKERNFGFIEDEQGEIYFFFFDKGRLKQLKKAGEISYVHHFISGDRVSFQLRLVQQEEGKIEAYNVTFIANERKQNLIDNFSERGVLDGYLKIFDSETIFVKDRSTYVYTPIQISAWEENLDDVYFNRENQLVRYKLNQTVRTDKLTARLNDAKYIDEYYQLLAHFDNQTSIPALITGRYKLGLLVTIFDGTLKVFIKVKDIDQQYNSRFKKGDIVDTYVSKISYVQRRVTLMLRES
jgi:ribosomal protein S1